MKLGSGNTTGKMIWSAVGAAALSLAAIASAGAQATSANGTTAGSTAATTSQKAEKLKPKSLPYTYDMFPTPKLRVGTSAAPLLSQQAFRNIQVLRDIPATQFIDTMGFFSASLVETCTYCHSEESDGSWAHYADDTNPIKLTARKMVFMTNNLNKTFFAGRQVVTCYSCHHGTEDPKSIPSLAVQYAVPDVVDPDDIAKQDPNAPTPKQLLDKYFAAIGGADKVAKLTSYSATGTYQAYSASEAGTANLYAKAPGQHSLVLTTASGDTTVTVNGPVGWQGGPDETTPLPVVALAGVDLNGYKLDALLAFPSQITKALTHLRVGTPLTLDGQDYQILEGNMTSICPTTPGGTSGCFPDSLGVKLYFDAKTGLLLRERRYIHTLVGRNPYQIDYSDFRDVDGMKMPFHLLITWTDGRSNVQFNSYKLNPTIDAKNFRQPAAPKPAPDAGN